MDKKKKEEGLCQDCDKPSRDFRTRRNLPKEHRYVNNEHIPKHMSTTQNIKETHLTLTS